MQTTFIQLGRPKTVSNARHDSRRSDKSKSDPLGVELGWISMQIRRLGRRHLSFEIGILDSRGREGVIRCSSFQVSLSLLPVIQVTEDVMSLRLHCMPTGRHRSYTCL